MFEINEVVRIKEGNDRINSDLFNIEGVVRKIWSEGGEIWYGIEVPESVTTIGLLSFKEDDLELVKGKDITNEAIDRFLKFDEEGYCDGCYYVPRRMMSALVRYILKGEIPGGFLTAVLQNDLFEAIGRADEENRRNLPAFVSFIYNEAPSTCWGSKEHIKQWADTGGLYGMVKSPEPEMSEHERLLKFMDDLVDQGYLDKHQDGSYTKRGCFPLPHECYAHPDYRVVDGQIMEEVYYYSYSSIEGERIRPVSMYVLNGELHVVNLK